jgi:hypothetical protein
MVFNITFNNISVISWRERSNRGLGLGCLISLSTIFQLYRGERDLIDV